MCVYIDILCTYISLLRVAASTSFMKNHLFPQTQGQLTLENFLEEKLDVRINQDGTCGVPGLTETAVNNVDDVLKCIGDTWFYGEGSMVSTSGNRNVERASIAYTQLQGLEVRV